MYVYIQTKYTKKIECLASTLELQGTHKHHYIPIYACINR